MKCYVLFFFILICGHQLFSQEDTIHTNNFEPLFKSEYAKKDSLIKTGSFNERLFGRWIVISIDTVNSDFIEKKQSSGNGLNLDSLVFKNNHLLNSFASNKEDELFWILNKAEDSLFIYHNFNKSLVLNKPIIFTIKKLKRSKLKLNYSRVHHTERISIDITFRRKVP